jgi:hypothetical protein
MLIAKKKVLKAFVVLVVHFNVPKDQYSITYLTVTLEWKQIHARPVVM